ncbi:hypothetical protein BJ165DRAFT_1534526 [Panaeolus papilionaceus]|nr:hypothetical protein BJ165DRAFT_1534526 [Panaeolus papilionaceus]
MLQIQNFYSHVQDLKRETSPIFPNDEDDTKVSIKKKKDDAQCVFIVSIACRAKLMEGTTFFNIPDVVPVAIARMALNREYHCATVAMMWAPKDKPYRFLTPNYEFNPDMVRGPGEPGLILDVWFEEYNDGPYTLFYKLENTKKVLWGYAGEYDCTDAGVLPEEEFAFQKDLVKQTWGKCIASQKFYKPVLELRARITMRKWSEEINAETLGQEVAAIRSKGYPEGRITTQDAIDALSTGEEHIHAIRLQCVGYSHEKARTFLRLQAEHEKLEEDKKKAGKSRTTTKRSSPNGRAKPRKPTKVEKRSPSPTPSISSITTLSDDDETVESTTSLGRPAKRAKIVNIQPKGVPETSTELTMAASNRRPKDFLSPLIRQGRPRLHSVSPRILWWNVN